MAKSQTLSEAELIRKAFVDEDARRAAAQNMHDALRDGDRIREECQTLMGYIRHAWHVLEPATNLKIGWAVEAMADHLEAVHYSQILRLLINCPPGLMKSLLLNVFFPSWEWGPKGKPHLRYACTSYGLDLTNRDGMKFINIITSNWYRALWPDISLTTNAIDNINNNSTGSRVGFPWKKSMGKRGNRFMFDDPHDLENAESDTQREATVRIFKEGASSRLNDQKTDAMIGIMQRLHGADVSGYILENDTSYVHLMLPQEFERERKCITYRKDGTKLFEDPRRRDGELLMPERFDRAYVDKEKSTKGIGPYAFAGQHQQRPAPRGGGLFQKDWFKERMVKSIADLPAPITDIVRAWDLAATDLKALQKTGARTAGVKMARMRNKEYVVLHCVARGYAAAKVKKLIKSIAEADGQAVTISAPQDPGQAGKVQKVDFIKELAGFDVKVGVESGGDKATRFTPFSIQCEFGNVWILEGEWNDEFFEELEPFPNGNRKDVADACSRGFAHLLIHGDDDGDEDILLMQSKNILIEDPEDLALQ